jgi:hypothetical protein
VTAHGGSPSAFGGKAIDARIEARTSAWLYADHPTTPAYCCDASMGTWLPVCEPLEFGAQRTAARLEAITLGKLRHCNISQIRATASPPVWLPPGTDAPSE